MIDSVKDSLERVADAGDGATATATATILVVEDEAGIVDFLERGLRAAGFQVTSATDGVTGEERALSSSPDLVVLDMMLPGRSGAEILATLRERKPELPVIVLTARGEVRDRVSGLDAGAVDYLVKPFALAELAARVRAQLRSARRGPPTRMRSGDIEVDLLSREVRRRGESMRLSTTEFDLLVFLVRNRRRVRLARADPARGVGLPARPWYEHRRGVHRATCGASSSRARQRRRSSRSGASVTASTMSSAAADRGCAIACGRRACAGA